MKKLTTRCLTMLTVFLFAASTTFAQQAISGTVTDGDNSEPLIGANVLVDGTSIGTITDIDGTFNLVVPEGANQITISYAGYTDQTINVDGQSVINVALESGKLLDEIVVVGYGTQKSKEITSAVASVKEEDFNVGNVTSAAQLLQGKVAGLTISRANGDPNGQVGIRLRGLSTIGAQTEPLVILDGVPGASLSNIDPRDIESMDVLKDGSAAAIYGTRGSSGVIIVTTKKGTKGGTKIDYNTYISSENIARTPDVATAAEFRAAGGNDVGSTTDWYDEISQAGLAHSHNVSLSGGTETSNYRASFNYRDQNGVVVGTGFDQINGSLTLNQKALDNKLNLGVNLIVTDRNSDIGLPEAFRYATILNPTSAVRNEDGTYNDPGGFDVFNPVAMVELADVTQQRKELLANVTASYNITPAIKITGSYAKQRKDINVDEYYPSNLVYRGGVARNGLGRKVTVNDYNDLYEGTAQYTGESGNITYTVLAGTSFQRFNTSAFGVESGGFLLDLNGVNQLGQAADNLTGQASIGSFGNGYRLQAQFGRVNVNVDDTYFVSASVRREGSDRFGPDNRYGIFPAVSAGVNIANLANISGVDNLKVRIGYGVTGNLPADNYLYASIFNPGDQFFYNGNFVPSYGPTTNSNPDLKWETKTELNFGVDFALQNSKITGALDVFNRKTEDLILLAPVPVPPNLAPNTYSNVASFSTNGIELAVNYNLIKNDRFSYTPGLIFTKYKTILDSYLEDQPSTFRTNLGAPGQNIDQSGVGLHLLVEGEAIGQITAPIYEGVDETGAYIFKDVDGDGSFSAPGDWEVVANGLPDFEMSLNNAFTIGSNFDLNLFFRGSFGHSLVNTYRAFYEAFPDNAGANFIKTSEANEAVKTASYNDTHVESASFVKLDNAAFGYTFDTRNSKLGACRVYIAGQNLVTFTGYTGVDPEVILGDPGSVDNGGRENSSLYGYEPELDVLAPGVDRRNTYFSTRTITLGANISF